jgi:hypothetical protein
MHDVFPAAVRTAATASFAGGIVLISAMALAEQPANPPEEPGFFTSIGRWFERQGDNIKSTFRDAGQKVENFGHEAGVAARTTAEGARGAADAVARIPNARTASGHEKCINAPNGAPDCVAAATALCKAKGFESGKSLDMTTAQICSPKAYLSGRVEPGDCHDETFVSRALCQ